MYLSLIFDVVIMDGRSAITRLQEIAKEFEQGKLDLATNADVKVTSGGGENLLRWIELAEVLHQFSAVREDRRSGF